MGLKIGWSRYKIVSRGPRWSVTARSDFYENNVVQDGHSKMRLTIARSWHRIVTNDSQLTVPRWRIRDQRGQRSLHNVFSVANVVKDAYIMRSLTPIGLRQVKKGKCPRSSKRSHHVSELAHPMSLGMFSLWCMFASLGMFSLWCIYACRMCGVLHEQPLFCRLYAEHSRLCAEHSRRGMQ